jgi:hypothetical protein
MMKRLLPALLPLVALLFTGCAGYQYGTSLANYKSICVKTFVNKSEEPNLEFAATKATLQEFQTDGSLDVGDSNSADLILETTLADAEFEAVRFSKTRSATASEYRMTVSALITLSDRRTGGVLIAKRRVKGEASFTSLGDAQQARLNAQPRVSQDLARQIVKNVVEFW